MKRGLGGVEVLPRNHAAVVGGVLRSRRCEFSSQCEQLVAATLNYVR
eukprot:CAMPEP_0118651604 /NCGR_PEP_ID=MMETSP0785-20121206/10873_1 /TAXON_ID=91992 /ORGANISM="Bolidomonas pacifica, Strain CCMP 1866" /LENGTH=46 /DNA_ID= /DNA_START= /DNA_END= /DNA_ORIENTATION=